MGHLLKKFILAAVCIALITPSTAWGLDVHEKVTEKAIQLLPEEWKSTFLEHKEEVLQASIDPDLRKDEDPAERARHYDDQDEPHKDRNVSSTSDDYALGVVAWAAENATDALTKAFEDGNITSVIIHAGDIAHYVADAAQPLHATKNYDGQLTGNSGIHRRYETEMVRRYSRDLFAPLTFHEPVVIEDAFALVEEQVQTGLELVPDILTADDKAKAEDPDKGDLYYEVLFNETKDFTRERLRLAVQNTINLWFTALVGSGAYQTQEPSLPSSSSQVTPTDETPLPILPAVIALVVGKERKPIKSRFIAMRL